MRSINTTENVSPPIVNSRQLLQLTERCHPSVTGYTIIGLDFDHSARSLMVPDLNISHEQYFRRKGLELEFPDEKPMIVVEGRHKKKIYFPPELVTVSSVLSFLVVLQYKNNDRCLKCGLSFHFFY